MSGISDYRKKAFEILKATVLDDEGKFPPPAFTSGLIVFLIIVHLLSYVYPLQKTYSLDPWAIYNFEFSKLSMYPLVHSGLLHLCLNIITLVKFLSKYEKRHGTVHCGIVLNTLATWTAIPYCLFGMLLWPNTAVLGSSGWCFSLIAFMTYGNKTPVRITSYLSLPQWAMPYAFILLLAIMVPNSSFVGHLLGMGTGYALRLGWLRFMVEPPSKVVEWIESKLQPVIGLIPGAIVYYKEAQMRDVRAEGLIAESTVLPLAHLHPSDANLPAQKFPGEGNVLGTA
ncbi:unnamed protein product [Kuraishia capsulata CBS 1993]|uniref:Rhomboid-type serine protease 2 n=1 Tax=Kuraishia capsulata CBS 1993 TaxID=1382522 RepID=W6MKV7_9ASCO|nr:uncharacterized protein KUCA_T00003003001 [Kuraishia capsulata CBS 1993]CDK27026.1 unnamed protein product [Kuraishia capsulata CBS 1993]